jgi:cell division protein FtsL
MFNRQHLDRRLRFLRQLLSVVLFLIVSYLTYDNYKIRNELLEMQAKINFQNYFLNDFSTKIEKSLREIQEVNGIDPEIMQRILQQQQQISQEIRTIRSQIQNRGTRNR